MGGKRSRAHRGLRHYWASACAASTVAGAAPGGGDGGGRGGCEKASCRVTQRATAPAACSRSARSGARVDRVLVGPPPRARPQFLGSTVDLALRFPREHGALLWWREAGGGPASSSSTRPLSGWAGIANSSSSVVACRFASRTNDAPSAGRPVARCARAARRQRRRASRRRRSRTQTRPWARSGSPSRAQHAAFMMRDVAVGPVLDTPCRGRPPPIWDIFSSAMGRRSASRKALRVCGQRAEQQWLSYFVARPIGAGLSGTTRCALGWK